MKYFLCFGFENFSEKDLSKFHVTLIYLGKESLWNVNDIMGEVNNYFKTIVGTPAFNMAFSKPELFGRDKDLKVLLPDMPMEFLERLFHKKLRDRLSVFQEFDDFPFNPHLTTELAYFEGRVSKLFLCSSGYEIVEKWDL